MTEERDEIAVTLLVTALFERLDIPYLIAAAGLGLGAVWIGVYPHPSHPQGVAEILGIPEGVIPLCVICVGHPAEEKPARTQYDEHRVHWQCYEPRKRRAKLKNAKYE